MRPVDVLYEGGEFVVIHECTRCGVVRRNRCAPDDDVASWWH
jgi:hypothetical protein